MADQRSLTSTASTDSTSSTGSICIALVRLAVVVPMGEHFEIQVKIRNITICKPSVVHFLAGRACDKYLGWSRGTGWVSLLFTRLLVWPPITTTIATATSVSPARWYLNAGPQTHCICFYKPTTYSSPMRGGFL